MYRLIISTLCFVSVYPVCYAYTVAGVDHLIRAREETPALRGRDVLRLLRATHISASVNIIFSYNRPILVYFTSYSIRFIHNV